MNDIDFSKRTTLKAAGVFVAASGGFVKPANADPIIIGAVITGIIATVVQGIYAMSHAKEEAKLRAESEFTRWHLERVNFYLGTLPAEEQMALLSNRDFVNTVISGSVDSYGTILAVADGRVRVERGQYKGTITADQAMVNGNVIMKTRDTAAVPVTPEQRFEDSRLVEPFKEYQADAMRISLAEYNARFTPKTYRKFSNNRYPTTSNADMLMVTAVNNGQWLDQGRNLQKSTPQIQILKV